jgi:hypothetical protein
VLLVTSATKDGGKSKDCPNCQITVDDGFIGQMIHPPDWPGQGSSYKEIFGDMQTNPGVYHKLNL